MTYTAKLGEKALNQASHTLEMAAGRVDRSTQNSYRTQKTAVGALKSIFRTQKIAVNEVRKKYVAHVPKDLGAGEHCVIEELDTQWYTGKVITPIPKAYYLEDGKSTVELFFPSDFTVTYKNNTNVGTADITIHGQGHYRGKKHTTFNIARRTNE